MTSTQTVEKPKADESRTDAGDHDRFSHYFKKSDLEKAWLDGQAIRALCGKIDIPQRDPNKYPVCPECKDVFESLRD